MIVAVGGPDIAIAAYSQELWLIEEPLWLIEEKKCERFKGKMHKDNTKLSCKGSLHLQ